MAAKKKSALWRCPKCGREFAQRSSYHGCGQYTVQGYLEGKNPAGVALFNQLVQLAQKISPFTLSPAKTQVSFRTRSNFIMVAVSGRNIAGYLFLPRAVPAPFVQRITAASATRHVHHFKISDPLQLEGQFTELLSEAIAMVSDAPTPAKSSTARIPTIGEEINALYRAQRQTP